MNNNSEAEDNILSNEKQDGREFQEAKNSPENRIFKANLPSFLPLFKETLKIYKDKLKTLLGLSLFPGLTLTALSFLGKLSSFLSAVFILFLPLIVLLGIILIYWSIIAMIYVIQAQSKIGIFEALKESSAKFSSFLWIVFLANLVVMGGSLPFIIPGIVLGIAFMLSSYVYIVEDKKGFGALLRSSDMTRGLRWAIFWRYFALFLMILIIFSPFFMLLSLLQDNFQKTANDILSWLVSVLVMPLTLAFGYLIYQKLAEFSPATQFQPSKKGKHLYIFLSIWGIIGTIFLVALPFLNFFLNFLTKYFIAHPSPLMW